MFRLLAIGVVAWALSACDPAAAPGLSATAARQAAVERAGAEDAAAQEALSKRLNAWFDARFEEWLLMSPSSLTRLGRKERYDEYDDLTEAEEDRQLAWLAATVDELKSDFDYSALDRETQTSYDLWVHQYERELAGSQHRRSSYVFTQMLGPQSSLARFLINFHKVEDENDMAAYIRRIGAISRAILQLLERAQVNAAAGVRPPLFAYEVVIAEARNLVTGAPFTDTTAMSPLWADATAKITALLDAGVIDEARATEFREAARDALLGEFFPAYDTLIEWFSNDLDNADVIARGVGSLPEGEAFYDYRLKRMTTTGLTADEIHEIGLREVARLRLEMIALIERVGFEGDLLDFFAYLREDDRFYYPDTDAGRQAYLEDSDAYLSFIQAQLPDYFGVLPKADLVVKRVEAFREQDGAPQHYVSGTPDGSRPGVYYAHLSDMRAMPKGQMEAIAYHEGNPGHHMQISIAQELSGVPQFRTLSSYTAYSEGWGLYAELLAREMGAYQDIYAEFGRLITEMWRAVRLVVDTGIHSKGWSEEGAIAYFKENTAIADEAVRAEVQRYIVWPGQATAYKIGMLKILELRAFAEQELGDQFDIREFHDTVLGGGALPLTILDRRIRQWVAAEAREGTG